ncbi:MAG: hypothetical protein Kow0088_22190 [Anaerolineales bacterium]
MQPIRETLCLLVAMGYLNQHLDEYEMLITPPRYLCTSCGRVASEAEILCLPRPSQFCEAHSPEKATH